MDVFALLGSFAILAMIIGPFVVVIFLFAYRREQARKSTWRTFAETNNLKLISGNIIWGTGACVIGQYRDRELKLETVLVGRERVVYTILTASLKHSHNRTLGDEPSLPPGDQAALEQFIASDFQISLPGGVYINQSDRQVCYEQRGIETNVKQLQYLADLLVDLIEAYPAVVSLGGEMVPALKAAAENKKNSLHPVAVHWLRAIAAETTGRLESRAALLLCPHCLARCAARDIIRLAWRDTITYYGCRVCGQSREFLEAGRRVIAVLDSAQSTPLIQGKEATRVNWPAHPALFDFDEVEIKPAADQEVERFAILAGNDTDPWRRPRYKEMRCVVSPERRLSENTMRILRHTFGEVKCETN